MNIPPAILEKIYNQGGDDDGDDHKHEDEQNVYTQWRLATNSDGSPLLSVYNALSLLLLREHVLSPMVALSGPIPTLVACYSGWILVC